MPAHVADRRAKIQGRSFDKYIVGDKLRATELDMGVSRRMLGIEEVVHEREKFVPRRNELNMMRLYAVGTQLSPHRLQTVGRDATPQVDSKWHTVEAGTIAFGE
jgi:hypothetical protein